MSERSGSFLWLWVGSGDPPPGALAAVDAVPLDEGPSLTLAAWPEDQRPSGARVAKVAAGLVDARGAAARISLVLVRRGVRVPFDDQAVIQARRASLDYWPWRAMSTLVRGDAEFAGAVSALALGSPPVTDPFARIAPARALHVPPGFVGAMSGPAGPVLERYGSAKPWPLDVFD